MGKSDRLVVHNVQGVPLVSVAEPPNVSAALASAPGRIILKLLFL